MSDDKDKKIDDLERQIVEFKQLFMILAGAFPTKLLLGKTGERIDAMIKKIEEGKND